LQGQGRFQADGPRQLLIDQQAGAAAAALNDNLGMRVAAMVGKFDWQITSGN
jgi:hypothetical protein